MDKFNYKRYSGPAVRCYSGLQGEVELANKTRLITLHRKAGGVVLERQTVSGELLLGAWRSTGGLRLAALALLHSVLAGGALADA